MAQVVRPQGFIAPIILLIVGIVLLFNGVPALFQWLGWVMQSSLVLGIEPALETAGLPLLLAGAATFIGYLMARGGWSSLLSRARVASSRAQEQVRTGAQQVRREVDQRYGHVSSQAEHLQNQVPQSWRERIDAAAREVESERARRSGQQPQVFAQGQQRGPQPGSQQRPQGGGQPTGGHQQQRAPQGSQPRQPQGYRQQSQQRQPQQRPAGQQPPREQQAPGAERLSRVEELRQEVAARAQQAGRLQDAGTQAAGRLKQAAIDEAARVQQRQLPNPSDEVAALIGRLDAADTERIRRRGSALTRSSLSTSALAKTSLRLDSLLLRRH